MSIKVLVVDDHSLLRQVLKEVLKFSEDIEVVGEAADGEEALVQVGLTQPDVILLDINMPKMDGIQVLKHLRERSVAVKIIVLTMHDDEYYLREMMQLGADGYLLKAVESNMLVEAIKVVFAGDSYIYPTLAKKLLNISGILRTGNTEISLEAPETAEISTDAAVVKKSVLTAREIEVLQLVTNGYSNIAISAELFLSEKTVKNHLTNIFRKLDVTDRTQAVLKALKDNIVTVS